MVHGHKNVIANTLLGAEVLKMTKTAKATQYGTIPEKRMKNRLLLILSIIGLALLALCSINKKNLSLSSLSCNVLKALLDMFLWS